MRIKATCGRTTAVISDIPETITLGELRERLAGALKLDESSSIVELFSGVPPRKLEASDATAAAACGVLSGSIVELRVVSAAAPAPKSAPPAEPAPMGAPPAALPPPATSASAAWTCAACTLANDDTALVACVLCGTARPTKLSRFVVPADNSCLFTAVGMLLDEPSHRMDRAPSSE